LVPPMAFAVAAWFVSKMIRGFDGVAVLGGAVGVVWRGAWGWYGLADVAAVGDWGSGAAGSAAVAAAVAGADTDAGVAGSAAAAAARDIAVAAAAGDSEAVGRLEPGGRLPYAAAVAGVLPPLRWMAAPVASCAAA